WVYTTPNIYYVPEPHINTDEEMQARSDGWFGAINCFQWPQLYSKDFEYAVYV
ncbi:hypothetical protein PAXRUDRAFT_84205, partial [Paxillus rubicundulus Ve08.2h10]